MDGWIFSPPHVRWLRICAVALRLAGGSRRKTRGRTDTIAPALREIGRVTAALWSDVDDDGWPDLLLTLEWGT